MPAMTLNNFAVDHFRRQGYVLLRAGFDEGRAHSCLDVLHTHLAAATPPLRRDASGNIVRLGNVASRVDGQIINLLLTDCVRAALRSLLGPNVVLVLNRHNHATPSRNGETAVRFHRDVLQWSRPVLTAIFYLEPAGVSEGCTWVLPGSQYLPQTGIPNNGGTWLDEQEDIASMQEHALPVPVSAGDVLLFDSLMFHSIGLNTSSATRWTVILAFRSVDELAAAREPTVQLLEGAFIYRGNELKDEPPSDWRTNA